MQINNVKNIVILKSLPSNIVEEAIIILKSNKYAKKFQMIEKNNKNESEKLTYNSKDYIIKEAESLITSYASKIENKNYFEKPSKILKTKYERLKKAYLLTFIILIISLIINFI